MSDEVVLVNETDHPRTLLHVERDVYDRLTREGYRFPGTVRRIFSFSEVEPSEWDCIITDQPIGHVLNSGGILQRDVPSDVAVLILFGESKSYGVLDIGSVDGLSFQVITAQGGVPGSRLEMPSEIGTIVSELVKADLVPVAKERARHVGIRLSAATAPGGKPMGLTPFLIGPKGMMLAGAYQRAEKVNFVFPLDVPVLSRWLDLAYLLWSRLDPERFPTAPDWWRSEEWFTLSEHKIKAALEANDEELQAAELAHARKASMLEKELADEQHQADAFERTLITGHGDALARAVSRAFSELGFDVDDMDETWRAGARREDYRLKDASHNSKWIALLEVTGTKRGLSHDKFQKFQNHVMAYTSEERPERGNEPSRWLVVNQEFEKEPKLRHAIFEPHFRQVVSDGGSLIIESVALFQVLMAVRRIPQLAAAARTFLRSLSGVLDVNQTRTWVDSQIGQSHPRSLADS